MKRDNEFDQPDHFIISGDLVQAQRCFEELASFGGRYRTRLFGTVKEARKKNWPERSRRRVSRPIRDRYR